MKKMISLAVVAVLAMTMAACGTLGTTGTSKSLGDSRTGSYDTRDVCQTPEDTCNK